LAGLELSDAPGVTVHLIGGLLRPHELSMIGPDAVEGIKKFNCDTFVMGVAGLDAHGGVSDYHYDEAHVKETGINVSNRVIVAADKSKLGRTALVKIADLSKIDILVTDADPDQPTVQSARLEGVQVVTISPAGSHQ
jgi:DeoR/GlpR family transcriptional regulator of sugar metabolism